MIVTMTSRVSFNTQYGVHLKYKVNPDMVVINASPLKEIYGTHIKLGDLKIIDGAYPMFKLITDDPVKAERVYVIEEWHGDIDGDYMELV